MSGNSLIDLGKLAEPATKLIEKVSDAVGGIAKPWQIKRVASAEAAAAKIAAIANIEINELEQRALTRMVREEAIKQENIESITMGAAEALNEDAKPENLDNDWLFHFFEKSKIISDKDMQTVWSRILAQEATEQNSFSKKTIETVSCLSKTDAELFTSICSYVWQIRRRLEIIVKIDDLKPDGHLDVYFSQLMHMQDLGLITLEYISGFVNNINHNEALVMYYGVPVLLHFGQSQNNKLKMGCISLTQAGRELAIIAGSKPNMKYHESTLIYWMEHGTNISTPVNAREKWQDIEPNESAT